MKKYSIFMMCTLMVGLFSCNERNKNSTNPTPTTKEAREMDHGKTMTTDPNMDPASMEYNWGQDYNRNMDISKMYSDLDMTDKQISDYEMSSQAYLEKLSTQKEDGQVNNQAILVHKDSSLKSVLTPEQYKKYKSMVEKHNDDKN